MNFPSQNQDFRNPGPWHRLPIESLKCCPLCGALNSRQNGECFVCRWQGDFVTDEATVREGLESLVQRCPSLVDDWPRPASAPRRKRGAISRASIRTRIWLRVCIRRLFRRRLDLSA
jgi:hypothetical protein